MASLKQSTVRNRTFFMVESADHITPLTGATVTVNISKNAAGFGAAAGSVSEIADGWYAVALTAVDTGTLGDLAFYCTAASADPTLWRDEVTANILGDTLPSDVQTIKTQTVACGAGVTVAPFVGNATAAIGVTAGGKITEVVLTDTATTVTNLTNAATAGDFTATMKASIGTAVAASAVASVTGNVGGNVVGSVGSVAGNVAGSVASVTGNVGGQVVGSVGGVAGDVTGDVEGKVLGGGGSSFAGVGVQSDLEEINGQTKIEGETILATMEFIAAFACGKSAGFVAGASSVTFAAMGGAATRIAATVDANGNRTAVTLTP